MCETLCTAMRFYCIIATSSWETVSICIQFPLKYHKYTILDIDYDVYFVMYFLGSRISVQKGLTLYEFNANDHLFTTRISCIIVPWENFWFLYHLSPSQLYYCEYKGRLLKMFVFLWKERARLPVNDLRLLAINTEWIFFSSRFFLTDFDKIVSTYFDKILHIFWQNGF